MKKILRRILAVVLILLVAGVAAGVRYFTYDPDKKNDDSYGYVTDNEGMTYTMVADQQGTTYVVVTDSDGNRYAAEYDGTTVGSTVGGINSEVSLDDVPTNFTGAHVDVSNDINKFQGDVSTTMPTLSQQDNTTTTGKATNNDKPDSNVVTTKPQQSGKEENKLKAYRIDKYQKIFQSGTYLMTMTTNDSSMGDTPVTMAIKNNNMYVKMSMDMEGTTMNCSMIYLTGKDTMYLIFDDWKKYCKMPKDMMGEEMDMSSMMSEMGTEEIGEITVSEVEINGEKLILESYVSATDGTTVNYYFQDDVLVRRDNVYSDGHVDSTFFALLTTDVPDSYFEIPKGYGYINLSFLEAFA